MVSCIEIKVWIKMIDQRTKPSWDRSAERVVSNMAHVISRVGGWAVYPSVAALKIEQEWMISTPNTRQRKKNYQKINTKTPIRMLFHFPPVLPFTE